MSTTSTQCPICQEPLTGRADQLVCSPACRVKARRLRLRNEAALQEEDDENEENEEYEEDEEEVEEEQEDVYDAPSLPAPGSRWSASRAQAPFGQREEEARRQRAQEQAEQAEEAAYAQAQYQRQVQALHRDYMLIIEQLLQLQDQWLTIRELSRFHAEITQCLTRYKEHPDLADPANKARKRATDLREALLLIGEVLEEAKADRGHGHKGHYELAKRWRKKLLERLNP